MSIEIRSLTHIYGLGQPFEKTALENINFHINKGEFVGIIGHTGSGKSTLIQMFNGLLQPTQGNIFVDGVDINLDIENKKEVRRKIGIVFQYPEYQLFEMTIYKDVAYGPTNLGLSEEEINERVTRSLTLMGMDESLWEKSPFELSGGQKRRVAIAGVIAMQPDILVLDEPTAGLDPKGREELFNQLKDMHKLLNMTIILVSHSMEDMARHADRLLVLAKGRLIYDNTPREVFKHIEELEKIGLAPPQIKYIVRELRQRGFDIREDILTVEEAACQIARYLKGGK
ncbi:energy-coupling factor transporter ATPase [Candidatus Epulonipiscium fishelsonii]|uniref:Energy-coupling factor transporter ATPase n=1 Tax=Candidatus Epulonipiscium fishelsonii TaxID=77094 RepID=A0ACC8XAI3_9FIRM|nr:energy-coupling factor transporter ATPase [Epulopiscium sp. SCG-B11WGA-EpuloA1]ONI40107.1 energy-coupling factor transporter ATPase [Epulopiscium sp. SCG-B05WGA-EpuloA1]